MQDPHIRSAMNDLMEREKKGIQWPFKELQVTNRDRRWQIKVELIPIERS